MPSLGSVGGEYYSFPGQSQNGQGKPKVWGFGKPHWGPIKRAYKLQAEGEGETVDHKSSWSSHIRNINVCDSVYGYYRRDQCQLNVLAGHLANKMDVEAAVNTKEQYLAQISII